MFYGIAVSHISNCYLETIRKVEIGRGLDTFIKIHDGYAYFERCIYRAWFFACCRDTSIK